MKKNRIRLTESQLQQVIRESVKRVLNEIGDTEDSREKIQNAVNKSQVDRFKRFRQQRHLDQTDKRRAKRDNNIYNGMIDKQAADLLKYL